MPIDKRKSKSTIIAELLRSYKEGGSFAKDKSPDKARQMAIAVAFATKRKQKGKRE